jgi:osmotically-inducible protein OsmY
MDRDDRYRAQEDRSWWDRTSDEVSSWFGDRDAERRRDMDAAQGGHRGRGPKGYARSDDRIREDVNDKLTDDAWLDASMIEVRVESGEVTLSGAVENRSDKRRAEDIAERVSGVTHVQNNLRLRQREEATTTTMGSESTITGAQTLHGRTQ